MSFSSVSSISTTNSLKELCVSCQVQPYDLVCTCGDKFDFTCIHAHVEQLGLEFEFIQNQVGERLLSIEAAAEEIDCSSAKAIVENWQRKRIQDIQDIAEGALNSISRREKAYSDVGTLRVEYNTLCEGSHRVVHEQLDSMVAFQRQMLDKSEELQTLPDLLQDDVQLDLQVQAKLNPLVFQQNQPEKPREDNPSESLPLATTDTNLSSSSETQLTTLQNMSTSSTPEASTIDQSQYSNPVPRTRESIPPEEDEFDAGWTAGIRRQDALIIPVNNDQHLATISCHKNQLLYNDINTGDGTPRLTFLADLTRITDKQIIEWTPATTTANGGDDSCVQDIAYSEKLQGYLVLTGARLRLLPERGLQLEDYFKFLDRNMKRVTCNERFLFLVGTSSGTEQTGDEILLLNDEREEVICKKFREIVLSRNQRSNSSFVGEISDLAVNTKEQILFSYRIERREEVGICMYNLSADGQEWTMIKQLLLNECWYTELSYTPRVEWCEKYQLFVVIEYLTSHLIMIGEQGKVKGESSFLSVRNHKDSPLNLSISVADWFCIRYATSINIHQLDTDRF